MILAAAVIVSTFAAITPSPPDKIEIPVCILRDGPEDAIGGEWQSVMTGKSFSTDAGEMRPISGMKRRAVMTLAGASQAVVFENDTAIAILRPGEMRVFECVAAGAA